MTKIEKCHIERSRNAFENDISTIFDKASAENKFITIIIPKKDFL